MQVVDQKTERQNARSHTAWGPMAPTSQLFGISGRARFLAECVSLSRDA